MGTTAERRGTRKPGFSVRVDGHHCSTETFLRKRFVEAYVFIKPGVWDLSGGFRGLLAEASPEIQLKKVRGRAWKVEGALTTNPPR